LALCAATRADEAFELSIGQQQKIEAMIPFQFHKNWVVHLGFNG
jgi:hypothetical protein